MGDKEKLVRLQALATEWRIQRDRLAHMVDTMPTDLNIAQYVICSAHVSELEAIING